MKTKTTTPGVENIFATVLSKIKSLSRRRDSRLAITVSRPFSPFNPRQYGRVFARKWQTFCIVRRCGPDRTFIRFFFFPPPVTSNRATNDQKKKKNNVIIPCPRAPAEIRANHVMNRRCKRTKVPIRHRGGACGRDTRRNLTLKIV